MFASLLVSIN